MTHASQKTRVVVLISGSGSNLQAFIDQSLDGTLPIEIVGVISNNPAAYGLQRAKSAGLNSKVINHKDFADKGLYEQQLQQSIDAYEPELILLAGFMRILGADFVNHYLGRMLNIHPSLLPKYRGLNTHQRALDNGDKIHGASVHYVTPELDGGPVIIQSQVPVDASDTSESLAKRVQKQEHIIYPIAVSWFTLNRLSLKNNHIYFDNKLLEKPVTIDDFAAS
ncbi:MAG TPA: phosphoribosylglycinamide formyltransferase [Gammaproteobacteria bacterium]|nr:phosphoribosylglycinamide formyltransferase [Gammaproteobacteria bacterium]